MPLQTYESQSSGITPSFHHAGSGEHARVPDNVAALHQSLNRAYAWLEGSKLCLALQDDYLLSAPLLIRAVNADPSLKPHILFKDRGVFRAYDDVVWDVKGRGLELARAVYLEKEQRAEPHKRLLLVPAVTDCAQEAATIIRCRAIPFIDKRGENLPVAISIKTDRDARLAYKMVGHEQIVQTDAIDFKIENRIEPEGRTLSIRVCAKSAMMIEWPEKTSLMKVEHGPRC